MKMAINGHISRGKEVIQILESLGGIKLYYSNASDKYLIFFIDDEGHISCFHHESPLAKECFKIYTLEEFEKEFPFKVGDKVTIVGLPDFPKVITKMAWDCDEILYSFEGLNDTWFGAKALKKFEMKEERNITLTLDKAQEWYKKGGELREIALQAFTEKELNPLPRSWEEFCKNCPVKKGECFLESEDEIMVIHHNIVGNRIYKNWIPSIKSAEAHLAMIQLEQLRDCWRQGWKPKPKENSYAIKIGCAGLNVHYFNTIEFLSFPTKEMAEEFLKCFKDLIEKAGDLI